MEHIFDFRFSIFHFLFSIFHFLFLFQGHWDVAKLIEKTFADRPNQFKNITVPYIVNLSKANYISIGLTEADEVKFYLFIYLNMNINI